MSNDISVYISMCVRKLEEVEARAAEARLAALAAAERKAAERAVEIERQLRAKLPRELWGYIRVEFDSYWDPVVKIVLPECAPIWIWNWEHEHPAFQVPAFIDEKDGSYKYSWATREYSDVELAIAHARRRYRELQARKEAMIKNETREE